MGTTEANGQAFLEHYGVKGMKWGVRRSNAEKKAASEGKTLSFKRITPKSGGTSSKKSKPEPSDDKKETVQYMTRVGKKGDTSALSNNELKKLNERMRLEQEFTRLSEPTQSKGQAFVRDTLEGVKKHDINQIKQGNLKNTKTVQVVKMLDKGASTAAELHRDYKTYKKYKTQAQNR